ncbi:MAG: TraX family protein [Lachnospiraceae bacterium]
MNTFVLKIIALVLMVIDHIGFYFEDAPIWFRWLGRSSYPLFLYCMVWGYHYTRNRKIYLLRLYFMSVFMTVFGYTIDHSMPTECGYGTHNIFLNMLWVGILISTIELFQKDRKKGGLLLGGIFVSQVLYYTVPLLLPFRHFSGDQQTGIMPNLHLNEYGFELIALGVLMYFLRDKKNLFIAMYSIFCINQFSATMLNGETGMQWLMILALPLMLQYNNQKGLGMKYFFYVFYPAHTLILFYLANYVF